PLVAAPSPPICCSTRVGLFARTAGPGGPARTRRSALLRCAVGLPLGSARCLHRVQLLLLLRRQYCAELRGSRSPDSGQLANIGALGRGELLQFLVGLAGL